MFREGKTKGIGVVTQIRSCFYFKDLSLFINYKYKNCSNFCFIFFFLFCFFFVLCSAMHNLSSSPLKPLVRAGKVERLYSITFSGVRGRKHQLEQAAQVMASSENRNHGRGLEATLAKFGFEFKQFLTVLSPASEQRNADFDQFSLSVASRIGFVCPCLHNVHSGVFGEAFSAFLFWVYLEESQIFRALFHRPPTLIASFGEGFATNFKSVAFGNCNLHHCLMKSGMRVNVSKERFQIRLQVCSLRYYIIFRAEFLFNFSPGLYI